MHSRPNPKTDHPGPGLPYATAPRRMTRRSTDFSWPVDPHPKGNIDRMPPSPLMPHRGVISVAVLAMAIALLWMYAYAASVQAQSPEQPVTVETAAIRAALAKGHAPDAMWAARR